MAYVITDSCIKDLLCVDACPIDCIHPKTDEAAFEAGTPTLRGSERLHRLRGLRPGVHLGLDTPSR
jgi:Na+-translocating ferredoxin:NAD+ oxidoreductase RNF subunit RnfB